MKQKIDIIVPVYDGYEETIQCIESVVKNKLDDNVFLNVINDCSPNKKLVLWLRKAAKEHHFTLYENEKNLGFVQTVNRGMSLHHDRDVILLNSDTIVAGDWVVRMQAHVKKDNKIASVTPFSNNATICSFPNFCEENELLPHSVNLIDLAFSQANAGKTLSIPTAIGFCMYITRACIVNIGMFDAETFGRGYGEENDFCMRATQAGWKNVVATDVFVAHIGGISFSSEKEARVESAQKILDELYPEYHKMVHAFIANDPLIVYRLQAYSELIRKSSKKVILLISHRLGGGVEKHIQELENDQKEHGFFVVIRPGNKDGIFEFSFSTRSKDKIQFSIPYEYEKMLALLRSIGVGKVYFHHTMGISPQFSQIAEDLGCTMDYMIHDYYLINANPTLTSQKGLFCDDITSRDKHCAEHYPLPYGISAKQWREGQNIFLKKCNRIYAPSEYTAKLFKQYFSNYDVQVVYHLDSVKNKYPIASVYNRKNDQSIKVLVLGAVSQEKGADLLETTALLAQKKNLAITFHLLGYAYRPLDGVIDHGAYHVGDVDEKISSISPDIIWYPALWPETYSYTLSEGLMAGCPIVAPNIGAFQERLIGRNYTIVECWKSNPSFWLDCFNHILNTDQKECNEVWRNIYAESAMFYNSFWYDIQAKGSTTKLDFRTFVIGREPLQLNNKEVVLVYLLKLRKIRIIRWFIKNIPISLQRKIKRSMSDQPMHCLLNK